MKFPITRESLQAFNKEEELAEQKEKRIQTMLELDIREICNEIESGMSKYSSEFESGMSKYSSEKQMRWGKYQSDSMDILSQHSTYKSVEGNIRYIKKKEYLPRLIEKLKETFIGCDIIITHPVHTWIIIDWS